MKINRTNRLSVSVMFIFALLYANTTVVAACLCPPMSVKVRTKLMLKKADAIFSGKVIKIESRFEVDGTIRQTVVDFEPIDLWKAVSTYRVGTSGGCSVDLRLGESYLVYAVLDSNELVTNLCYGTAEISLRKKDIKKLGKPQIKYRPTKLLEK